jgi:hypothetical protein
VHGFTVVRGHYIAKLDDVERRVLAAVVADTAELLGVRLSDDDADAGDSAEDRGGAGPDSGPSDGLADVAWSAVAPDEPSDPALARLLPPASRDDDALAVEFRRLTYEDLRATKVENLRLVWKVLRARRAAVVVTPEDAPRWAAALTDVRLVLASRLGIEDDEDAERVYTAAGVTAEGASSNEEDEVLQAMATLYAALTWLQESLVHALLEGGHRHWPGRRSGG